MLAASSSVPWSIPFSLRIFIPVFRLLVLLFPLLLALPARLAIIFILLVPIIAVISIFIVFAAYVPVAVILFNRRPWPLLLAHFSWFAVRWRCAWLRVARTFRLVMLLVCARVWPTSRFRTLLRTLVMLMGWRLARWFGVWCVRTWTRGVLLDSRRCMTTRTAVKTELERFKHEWKKEALIKNY